MRAFGRVQHYLHESSAEASLGEARRRVGEVPARSLGEIEELIQPGTGAEKRMPRNRNSSSRARCQA
jgi:hypothetical protein